MTRNFSFLVDWTTSMGSWFWWLSFVIYAFVHTLSGCKTKKKLIPTKTRVVVPATNPPRPGANNNGVIQTTGVPYLAVEGVQNEKPPLEKLSTDKDPDLSADLPIDSTNKKKLEDKNDSFNERQPVSREAKRAAEIKVSHPVARNRDDYKTLHRANMPSSDFDKTMSIDQQVKDTKKSKEEKKEVKKPTEANKK
ncbi:hypothetical protein M3Y98_00648000 [Aphelenchoides besseyi]|nr:hypothetical protein M3Y98_00648000 [Aphelenchoides besseyi]KAI6208650.1 hypothetical protein M3Y96_00137400 [Aphelenchoides besseyi]